MWRQHLYSNRTRVSSQSSFWATGSQRNIFWISIEIAGRKNCGAKKIWIHHQNISIYRISEKKKHRIIETVKYWPKHLATKCPKHTGGGWGERGWLPIKMGSRLWVVRVWIFIETAQANIRIWKVCGHLMRTFLGFCEFSRNSCNLCKGRVQKPQTPKLIFWVLFCIFLETGKVRLT